MKVLIFGASGMVGQGVLRECLLDPDVETVAAIGRSGVDLKHPKLTKLVHANLLDYSMVEDQLAGFDACFFCLGVTVAGKSEAEYERITYGYTVAAARALARLNPALTFIYVSGTGTDSSEKGKVMWARVKGRTENELLRVFPSAYMFRPGGIQAVHGERSKTPAYRIGYAVARPLLPMLRALFPNSILTTEEIGRAMINIAKRGASKHVLETADIKAAAA